ncbi:MAG: type II secretion system protein [Terracidiphilus sp.]
MNPFPRKRQPNPSEEGYILVAVIFMMAILILSLAIAVPRVRESIQRDREEETMQRGKQYVRAVQLYYRKFNAYPPNVDALVKTNNIRFLRKKYVDPTTGKEEWKSSQFGQNKTPQAMGFFGQPLAAANGAGIGPSGGNTGTTTGIGGTSSTTSSGLFNSSPTSSTDSGAGTTGQSVSAGTDANGNPTSGTGTTGATGTSGSAFGSSSNPTGGGQSFGGAGIIGFSPQSPKQSLMIYKKKNHYNEWEFLYSPMMDQQNMVGGNTGAVGQPASGTTTPIGSGTGTTPTAPTTPTTPTTPQQ